MRAIKQKARNARTYLADWSIINKTLKNHLLITNKHYKDMPLSAYPGLRKPQRPSNAQGKVWWDVE